MTKVIVSLSTVVDHKKQLSHHTRRIGVHVKKYAAALKKGDKTAAAEHKKAMHFHIRKAAHHAHAGMTRKAANAHLQKLADHHGLHAQGHEGEGNVHLAKAHGAASQSLFMAKK